MIEYAAESLGSEYQNKATGTWGLIGALMVTKLSPAVVVALLQQMI